MKQSESYVLEGRLQQIDAKMAELEKEREEIQGALDIVARYVITTTDGKSGVGNASEPESSDTSSGAPRPDGIPTLWEMTEAALGGVTALSASSIVDFIGEKYWPGVAHSQIGPSLYRFVKEGRLVKVGRGEFSLPGNEGNAHNRLPGDPRSGVVAHPTPQESIFSGQRRESHTAEAKAESADGTLGFHNPNPARRGA